MAVPDDLKIIKERTSGERVAGAIVSAMQTLKEDTYTEADIDSELNSIANSPYGTVVKEAIHDGLTKLSESNPSYYLEVTKTTKASYETLNPPEINTLYGISSESVIVAALLDSAHDQTGDREYFSDMGSLRLFLDANSDKLYHVYIGSLIDIDSISEGYFAQKAALYSIELSTNVKTIYGLAFASMPNLKEVVISSGTNSIEEDAFLNCDGVAFTINKESNSIAGSPWGAINSTVSWTG